MTNKPYITCERCHKKVPPSDLHSCGPGGKWRYCSRCVNEAEVRSETVTPSAWTAMVLDGQTFDVSAIINSMVELSLYADHRFHRRITNACDLIRALLRDRGSSETNVELRDAAEFASGVLAELYAKYQTKIGPFASQAQVANGRLRAALNGDAQA